LIFKGYGGYSSKWRRGFTPLTLPPQIFTPFLLREFFDRLRDAFASLLEWHHYKIPQDESK
jgi:hypothetical protein